LLLDLPDDSWNVKGKDEKTDGKEDLEGKEIPPVAAGPDLFQGADEKSKDKRPYNNTEARPCKVIPEPDFRQTHAKVHGGERKINQT
jgi:hypothetical protein